jgi:hypothetical protein
MKGIWLSLLGKIIEYLTSKEFVGLVKQLVYSMFEDDSKTSEEKRAHVLNELKKSGMNFGSNLAGLAIESFVTVAKEQGLEKLKQ